MADRQARHAGRRMHQCERSGRYRVAALAETIGLDGKLTNWLYELTADCPRKNSPGLADACGGSESVEDCLTPKDTAPRRAARPRHRIVQTPVYAPRRKIAL